MFKFDLLKRKSKLAMTLLATIVVLINLYLASTYIVSVPIVDGWAVWNRVMLLDFGNITWSEYLFTPHGAHPHSIVYLIAWMDFNWGDGTQHIMMAVSFMCTFIYALFINQRVNFWLVNSRNQSYYQFFIVTACTAALLSSLVDLETILQPFQVVMSFSRLIFIVLLWQLIFILRNEDFKKYIIILLLSCAAVTFHGSGYIFSAVFILLHILYSKKIKYFWISFLPVLTLFAVKHGFSAGGGELSQLGSIASFEFIVIFFKGVFSYFGTPLLYFLPVLGETPLLLIGFLIFLVTTVVTLFSFYKTFQYTRGYINEDETCQREKDEYAFVFAIGVFILLSAAAAAAMWLVRTQGAEGAYKSVLTTARYGAYASLGYVFLLCTVATFTRKLHLIKVLVPFLLFIAAMSPSVNMKSYYIFDDELNIASAGLATGLTPIYPETEQVWPGAKNDWYWVNELPKTVVYLKGEKKGPWSFLPSLYSQGNLEGNYIKLSSLNVSVVKSDIDQRRCHVKATLSGLAIHESPRSTLAPLVNSNREVIGYGTLTRRGASSDSRKVVGFALCDDIHNTNIELYIANGVTKWHESGAPEIVGVSAFSLTDITWEKGIAKNWSGFFITDNPSNRGVYVPGRILRFHNGEIRTVIKQEIRNGYVNVFLDGEILNGNIVGYPNKITPLN